MQIGAGLRRAGIAAHAVHPVELLDAAYAAAHSAARARGAPAAASPDPSAPARADR
jgi:hypothetical protein